MTAAIVCAASAVVAVTIVMLIIALDLRDAERRCADARVDSQANAGQLAIALEDVATQTSRANAEKKRADALDDLIAQHAAGPVDGAYERLLQSWRSARESAHASDGGATGPVPAQSPTTASGTIIASGSVKGN